MGGRPKRYAHAHEPTHYIDVYGLDGRYHRSYLLPSDTWSMATADARTFYVLTFKGDMPVLLGLRPGPSRLERADLADPDRDRPSRPPDRLSLAFAASARTRERVHTPVESV